MKELLRTTLLFVLAFCAERLTAHVVKYSRGLQTANYANISEAEAASADRSWGLSFPVGGQIPVGSATVDYLKQFNSYYCQNTQDKVIYLTFDAGYESGNTATILDALKKHNVPVTFLLVGNYLEAGPGLVKRMVAGGHTVGNHTFRHPGMFKTSTKESFEKKLDDLETLFQQTTGRPMKRYYRPPQGKYSESNLKMANDVEYRTFFWSSTYVDWYEDKQPSKEEAFKKLLGRIHSGAVVLLRSTSKTSTQILDELPTRWEKMGYRFSSLDDLVAAQQYYLRASGADSPDISAFKLITINTLQERAARGRIFSSFDDPFLVPTSSFPSTRPL